MEIDRPMCPSLDKEQAVLHLFNLYGLGPVHRGSYLPPKPEPEFPDSSDSGEDEGAAECDEDGEPILGKAKKQGKVLTPMAKVRRCQQASPGGKEADQSFFAPSG